LNHQNIVKLIDVFEDEASYSLVMELMEGGQLTDLI
jgi:serine/threonine protein kinase